MGSGVAAMLNILGDGWKSNTRLLMFAFAVSGTLGLAVVFTHSVTGGGEATQKATPYLWAFACVSVGSLVGFLFGIPRTTDRDTVPVSALPPKSPDTTPTPAAQDPAKPAEAAGAQPATTTPPITAPHRTRVNTNLEQVSDWLTKIIVGVGLTQLQRIPAAIQSVARTLSKALDPASTDPSLAFAEALVVYFTIIGFLYAYLLTRVYLQKVFDGPQPKQADPHDGPLGP